LEVEEVAEDEEDEGGEGEEEDEDAEEGAEADAEVGVHEELEEEGFYGEGEVF